ncbi:MAG: hypothetical protein J6V32_01425 [Elusimicrobiaceae bacterium]|nr:hypothetical protein [Elusimicrobiaceae bacterium]
MFATVAAAIALAMNTKPNQVVHPIKLSPAPNQEKPAFSALQQGLRTLISVLQKTFLPHLAACLAAFILLSFLAYRFVWNPSALPELLKNILAVLFLSGYGIFFLGYALLTAGVCALRQACVEWDEFIDNTIDSVQEKMVSHLDTLQEGIAKDQAKILVRGSVKEVFQSAQRGSMPRWIAFVGLGALMLAVRAVLTARIVKLAGTTVKVSKIFAGKATLVGAVLLNLRLFTTLILGVLYLMGLLFLLLNIIWVIRW